MLKDFDAIISLIKQSRANAVRMVNSELIQLYWEIGLLIHNKLEKAEWGSSVVSQLSCEIQKNIPHGKGFSDKNLWRMKKFYEIYCDDPKLSPAVREISWTHHVILISRCSSKEERNFYLERTLKENYSKRELDRQISSSLYERSMLNVSLTGRIPEQLKNISHHDQFKDTYILEFLGLSETHSEKELQRGLVKEMSKFILELGKDFLFVGQEYLIQIGNSDFYIDLLFYHRDLQCLVAFELKADKFRPEHLGQINLYLEALDRDVKKPKENPSIGVLLCKDQDHEVVEYALSRSLSPTMIAEYKLRLPDKKQLIQKLKEI